MTAQSTPATDDAIWEELLASEASHKFLAQQVMMAEDLLNSNTSQADTYSAHISLP